MVTIDGCTVHSHNSILTGWILTMYVRTYIYGIEFLKFSATAGITYVDTCVRTCERSYMHVRMYACMHVEPCLSAIQIHAGSDVYFNTHCSLVAVLSDVVTFTM